MLMLHCCITERNMVVLYLLWNPFLKWVLRMTVELAYKQNILLFYFHATLYGGKKYVIVLNVFFLPDVVYTIFFHI